MWNVGLWVELMATSPWWYPCRVVRRIFLRRSSWGFQFSWRSMSPTLDVWREWLITRRVTLLRTFSSVFVVLTLYGSQTWQAYSNWGRTNVLKARSFIEMAPILRFRRTKTRALLACMALVCLLQLISVEMVTPRYFASFDDFSGWFCREYVFSTRFQIGQDLSAVLVGRLPFGSFYSKLCHPQTDVQYRCQPFG